MIIIFFLILLFGILATVFCARKFRNTGQKVYLGLLILSVLVSLAALVFIIATGWLAWAVSVQPAD